MPTKKLEESVVVITGASSGFGKGAARRFAELGACVVVAARRGVLLQELARECDASGRRLLAVETDVSEPDQVEELAQKAIAQFGSIDVRVNNAGVGALGPFEKVPLSSHVQVIATNFLGTMYGSYFAYRQFLAQKAGILINIASELGRHTVPYYSSYTAAKHAVVGFGDALRQETYLKNLEDIHICTVMPTAHDTPFFDHAANYTGHEVQAPSPLHNPENVVDAIVRLATDPRDKEIVGADGVVKVLMKTLAPGLTEKLAAKQIHSLQMEQAPRSQDSDGAVHDPSSEGTEVSGGRNAAG